MIAFGLSDSIFSIFLGKIIQWTGRPAVITFGFLINIAVLVFFLLWRVDKDQIYVFYIGAAFWGISDSVWQTQVNGK